MRVVENAILSTDLAMYFKKKNRFRELVDNGEFDWQSEERKEGKLQGAQAGKSPEKKDRQSKLMSPGKSFKCCFKF